MKVPQVRLWMAVIFVLAIGMRVSFAWLTYGPDTFFNGEAERIGQALAFKGTFSDPYAIPTGPTAHCGPFYPALMSILYSALGTGMAAVLARIGLLIFINSMGCAVLPAVATALGLPVWAGIGAGLGAALLPMHRTGETFNAWDEPYSALGLMAALVLLMRWQPLRDRRLGTLATYGALWGFLLYLAAPLLPVLFGLAAFAVLVSGHKKWMEARSWLVVFGAAGLVLLPWTIRNRVQLGGWIYARSIFGLEFHVANTDSSGVLGDSKTHPSYNVAEAERVRNIGEIAYNRERLNAAIHWIQTHPGEFTVLTVKRFASFWLGWWGNPETAIVFTLTTMFAIVGARFLWRDRQQVLGVFGPVWICYPLVYYVVLYLPRYRIAMWWTVLLTAAYGAGRLAATIAPPLAAHRQSSSTNALEHSVRPQVRCSR